MRKILALACGLMLVGGLVYAERKCKTISATGTSQTVNLASDSEAISIYNGGANEVYIRAFQEGDTMAAATAADPAVYIGPGASVEFPRLGGEGRYFAISAICSGAETTTVYVYY